MNASELKSEITRLKGLRRMQSAALKSRVSGAKAIVKLLFPKAIRQDYLQMVSRALLPLAVNKIFFRNSGAIIRAFAGKAARLLGNFITEERISDLLKKIGYGRYQPK